MSQPWTLAIQRDSLRQLLALRSRERERLLDALAAGFTINYWLDHFSNEVRVMQLTRVGRG